MDRKSSVSRDLEERLDTHREGDHTGILMLSESEGYVGDTITLKGRNLTPDEEYELLWNSVVGRWGVLEANEIVGPQYQPRTDTMLTVTTDDNGRFEVDWEVPDDYGGEHTIAVQSSDGTTKAEATYEIRPWFELDRTEVPLGESFTVIGYGLGPNFLVNNYQITWDNGMVGFMTGVMNRGTAAAEVRAVGPVGKHTLQVWRNYRGVPFLQNNTQSPFGRVGGDRQSDWTVEVTPPETEPETAWIDRMWDETPLSAHMLDPDEETEAELEITPTSGQAGTDAFIEGRQFPPETEVDLVWYTHKGHRPKGIPITPEPREGVLPSVTTDENGAFQVEVTIPTALGSTRPILAEIDGRSVAATGFMMQPKIEKFTPTEGPVGTNIEIELSGIGWPMYGNAYYFVYDNKPVGYVCGLDEDEGLLRTELKAAGEPGYHFIDVYPSLFQMEDEYPDFVLKPHLSYGNNHPVRPLPALHLAFEVTE